MLDNLTVELSANNTQAITYAFANTSDSEQLVAFMRNHSQTAFCKWQDNEFINNALKSKTSVIILSKLGNTIIGAVIGGIMCSRATINHLAVDAHYRQQRIGHQLVNRCLKEIKQRGVKRVFLFVDNDNTTAMSFWLNHGFNPTSNQTTIEKDL